MGSARVGYQLVMNRTFRRAIAHALKRRGAAGPSPNAIPVLDDPAGEPGRPAPAKREGRSPVPHPAAHGRDGGGTRDGTEPRGSRAERALNGRLGVVGLRPDLDSS